MLKGHHLEELALLFEALYYGFIGLFSENSVERGEAVIEAALLVDELNDGKAVLFAHLVVVLAECGCDVNDARAVAHGYIGIADDVVRLCGGRGGGDAGDFSRGFGEERLIFQPLPLLAGLFG